MKDRERARADRDLAYRLAVWATITYRKRDGVCENAPVPFFGLPRDWYRKTSAEQTEALPLDAELLAFVVKV